MTSQTTADGWQLAGDSADCYERYLATAFAPWARALALAAGAREGARVLDVACGTGILARQAAGIVGPQGAVAGIDINPAMLRVAREVSADLQPAIDYRQASAMDLPFPDRSFDAVCSEQALTFFPDAVRALGEMRRVLADGGQAAVSLCRPIRYCPAYVILADMLDRHVSPDAGTMMRSPFSTWSATEVRGLFSAAGFERVHVRIEIASLRYPSVEEFLLREAASSPLADPVGSLDPAARGRLVHDLETALADRTDDDGVACAVEVYVVMAS